MRSNRYKENIVIPKESLNSPHLLCKIAINYGLFKPLLGPLSDNPFMSIYT